MSTLTDGLGRYVMPNDVDPARVLERMRELDRRKFAAGKKAREEQQMGQRAAWREAKRRNRAKNLQARTLGQDKRVSASQDAVLSFSEKDTLYKQLFGEPEPASAPKRENAIRSDLERLSRDRRAPASARVTALRTLAEMDGHIGRLQHQGADTSDSPLSTLSREQLENELVRLRVNAAAKTS
jgi:hypothetical protein